MRKMFLIGGCIAAIILGCAGQRIQPEPTQFTAHNIWTHRGHLYCINFKLGDRFIPAGTAVKDVRVYEDKEWPFITFRLFDTNKLITVLFETRWHPGKKVNAYAKKMFTIENFEELTRGLTPDEIRGIKNGVVTVGMSKRAVLVSYGTPPEHYTKSLASNVWHYWMNRRNKKKICFDENERAARCEQKPSGDKL